MSLSCSSKSPWVSCPLLIKDGRVHLFLLTIPRFARFQRGKNILFKSILQSPLSLIEFPALLAYLHVRMVDVEEHPVCLLLFSLSAFLFSLSFVCQSCECIHIKTKVQSSGVLILRVLKVSIESSWQLKEERKIGKWGGVSMLRPLPPHLSLAEDVWIYSGNAMFGRNKSEDTSLLLCVWIPSRGISPSSSGKKEEK